VPRILRKRQKKDPERIYGRRFERHGGSPFQIGIREQRADIRIADVHHDQSRPSVGLPFFARGKIVDNCDLMPLVDVGVDNIGPDEPCAAGH